MRKNRRERMTAMKQTKSWPRQEAMKEKVDADRSREEEGKDPYVDDVGRRVALDADAAAAATVEVLVLVEVPLSAPPGPPCSPY
jgi:hypothetical protein